MRRSGKMKSLAFYCTVFVFLSLFASNHGVHGAKGQTLTPEAREDLLARAKRWELPQPPAESALLKIKIYESESRDYFALGFVEPGLPGRALVGFDYWDITTKRLTTQEAPDPDALSLGDIAETRGFGEDYGVNF